MANLESCRMGLGTWHMGNHASQRDAEADALRAGIDAGVALIDTAEMYANGGAEQVVAKAIAGQRERVYLVSKVLPSNASYDGTITACERSLRRLETDFIDLYLLHWSSSYPLSGTIEAFEVLRDRGWIGAWGVSNFDRDEMDELSVIDGGLGCQANQVYYSLSERGVEFDLIPWHVDHDITTMAYCPLDQGTLANNRDLAEIARKHAATSAQIALAWLMTGAATIPIPKSSSIERTFENARSQDVQLDPDDLAELDRLFPAPTRRTGLKIV